MSAKTGLLIVSNPKQIGNLLLSINKQVQNTLYIQLLSALSEPFGSFHTNIFNTWPKYSHTIQNIYSQAATYCNNLDVRVLLTGLKHDLQSLQTKNKIDLVIFDKEYAKSDINEFLNGRIANAVKDCKVIIIDNAINEEVTANNCKVDKVYKHTVLGGTFDRLHIAHKLLLTEAALRSNKKITVGVTEETMLESKILWELIEPINERIGSVKEFLTDICPELESNVVPISDPFGPTQNDPTMDLLIVSDETIKGGMKVNEVRNNNGLTSLEVLKIELIDEPKPQANEESKISSSTTRMRLLGTLIKPVKMNHELPNTPYIIGLTGGIGSGKSTIAKRLHALGAHVIDCDKVAHELYEPGMTCYNLIVKAFGQEVVSENGQINRKALGTIVFQDKNQLQKLNLLVWPAIADAVKEIIKNTQSSIVVIEAAVLLTAGWQTLCHETWSCFIPEQEAIKRLIKRNNLTEEQAKSRIAAQPKNKICIEASNVVFCSLWAYEYTRQQVDLAWSLLQTRIIQKQ